MESKKMLYHLVELVVIGHREDHSVDFSEELDVVRSHVAQVDAPKLCRHLVTPALTLV